MPRANSDSTKEDYLQILLEPEHFELKKKQIAKLMGCSESTLYRWDRELDWDWIKDERRKKYSSRIAAVDLSMFNKAKKGDTRAAELVYKRFDDWVDTTKVIDEKALNDDELRDMAKEIGEELGEQTGVEKKEGSDTPRVGKKKKG